MAAFDFHKLEQQLGGAANFLDVLMQTSPDAISLIDLRGNILYMSPRGVEMLGYATQDELVGRNMLELIVPEDLPRARAGYAHASRGENLGLREYRFLRKDGSSFHVELNSAILHNLEGAPCFMLYVGRDITDRKKIEEELQKAYDRLQYQAVRDPLTALFNRRYMEETLERELARSDREELPLSVVMMDIDYFKQVNDTHGHKAGDLMLQMLARLLEKDTRSEDVVCRYGGEEFVAILPSASPAHAVARAESWRRAFEEQRITFEEKNLSSTLSGGVATFPQHGDSSEELLRAADKALYAAKASGRNRIKLASKPH